MINLIQLITIQQAYKGIITPGGEHHEIGDEAWLMMTMPEDPPLRSPKRTPDLASQ